MLWREAMPRFRWGFTLKMKELEYKSDDYVAAFRRITMAPHHMRMLQAHYHAPDRTLTATQMSMVLGYSTYVAANLHYGKLGRFVGEQIGWKPLPKQTVFVLVTFDKPGHEWHWIMRPAVADAIEQLGWIEAGHSKIPEEVDMTVPLYEGAVRRIVVNAYERSSVARERCIHHHGCRCASCGLILAEKYGEAAQGLIHVHHVRQLADVNAEYQVDPIQDLRPVCPTCHAVIHSKTPPFTIEEVMAMIEKQEKNVNQASEVTAREIECTSASDPQHRSSKK
jgi:5-methylcytosine-specific restriction enzyme A